jgi:NAD(P)-dependent dehydrogenase (short-subunit alcohol dehydrogenase family)
MRGIHVAAEIRTAVVTGGGRGIGRAICRRLHREGIDVAVCDIDEEAANTVAQEIGAYACSADVGEESQVVRLVAAVRRQLGDIDLFVSNAGVGFGDDESAASRTGGLHPVDDRWEVCWRVNVMAHVYAARALLPGMRERGRGWLVNVASAAGLLSQIGDAAYSATKHAAVAFAESLAITHGDEGIHVSVVCPQAVATRMIGIEDDAKDRTGGFGGNDIDGILEPDVVADHILDGIRAGRFMILPHPSVHEYFRRKADDHDRWIAGMQRFRRRLLEGTVSES